MAIMSAHEVGRMSTPDAGPVTAPGEAGSMSADVGGCKVAAAEATTVKTTTTATVKATAAMKAATMSAAAVAATTMALGSEYYGCKRQAAERENCSQGKD